MTEVDFYILPESHLSARDHFACRLAEKAFNLGRQIVLRVSDKDHADSMSEYLWSFKPESFLPHTINTDKRSADNAGSIIIDWENNVDDCHDVMINLGNELPKDFSRFKKLSEIVVQDDTLLATTRSHFQFYRERGYPLKSHKIGSS